MKTLSSTPLKESVLRTIEAILAQHSDLLYAIWDASRVVFDDTLPTACIRLSTLGKLELAFNPKFWEGLNDYTRAFVIAHECLHVILGHLPRMQYYLSIGDYTPRTINIGMDLVVNETLRRHYGMCRERITGWQNYVWLDTVLKGQKVPPDLNFSYYLTLLQKNIQKVNSDLVDEGTHTQAETSDTGAKELQKAIEKVVSDLPNYAKDPVNKELNDLKDQLPEETSEDCTGNAKMAGTESLDKLLKLTVSKKINRKWETIITRWFEQADPLLKPADQWLRANRRFHLLGENLILPSEHESIPENKKIRVEIYLDTSGSCESYARRFLQAGLSFPKSFEVKLFCFDTKVYEVVNNTLRGFGGTMFDILEENALKARKYPQSIFVITDGYGNAINPKYPQRWHWMLTQGSTTRFIPKGSKAHNLEDYE